MWRIGQLLVFGYLTLAAGCCCHGVFTKRENEVCCPTDIRKTHYWCFGEDAKIHGPCGPKEELYGYEPTSWREFPDVAAVCYGVEFNDSPMGVESLPEPGIQPPSFPLPAVRFAPPVAPQIPESVTPPQIEQQPVPSYNGGARPLSPLPAAETVPPQTPLKAESLTPPPIEQQPVPLPDGASRPPLSPHRSFAESETDPVQVSQLSDGRNIPIRDDVSLLDRKSPPTRPNIPWPPSEHPKSEVRSDNDELILQVPFEHHGTLPSQTNGAPSKVQAAFVGQPVGLPGQSAIEAARPPIVNEWLTR
jgi:hypothetical protein